MPAIINIPSIIGWLLAYESGTKLVITEHATMSYKAYIEHKNDLRIRSLPWLSRLLYPKASGLVANSQDVLEDLLKCIQVPMQEDRVTIIPNPIDIDAVCINSQAEPDHPWLLRKEQPVIMSVGRLAKQKNFMLLLRAFAIVRERLDARLIIVGEGPERCRLEKIIDESSQEEDISLPGFSDNPWKSMAKADVFVLASEEEAFGLVLVEAMACGVPVVATDAIGGGPRSILKNEKYGILVPNGDARALADAILEVIRSRELDGRLVATGRQRCEAFRPEIVAQQWLHFLERLS